MKQCPQCYRTYTDETLNFCLDDGEELRYGPASDEVNTALFPSISRSEKGGTPRLNYQDSSAHSTRKVFSPSISTRRLVIVGLSLVLGASVVGSVIYYFFSGRESTNLIDSIAVLPFQNVGGNSDAEYLSDGIAESLINNLTDLRQIKVTARSTAFRYKGKELDPQALGRELNVRAVLTGSVRQVGDRLNVQVDLIDTSNGAQIWGNEYERGLSDVIAVKQSIAREVMERLKLRLTGEQEKQISKRETRSPEAYQLYLRGRYLWGKRTPESIEKAIDYFDQAIEIDSTFALAYVGLADAYVVPANRIPPKEAMPKARAAAVRALEIDDTLAEAHTSLGRVLQVYDWNWGEAEKEFKRAIELNPRYAVAHQWYGGLLERTRNVDEGIAERKLALELDPLSPIIIFELGQAYYFARDYDNALDQYQRALELDPNFPAALQYVPAAYAQKGMYDEALSRLADPRIDAAIFSTGVPAHIFALAGRRQEAREMLDQLKRLREKEYVSAVSIALANVGLGETDEAIKWLEKGYEERAFQMQFLKLDPRWDRLRDDPRFVDLTRRIGLPQ